MDNGSQKFIKKKSKISQMLIVLCLILVIVYGCNINDQIMLSKNHVSYSIITKPKVAFGSPFSIISHRYNNIFRKLQ